MIRAQFLGHLREALNHLHDPDRLIRSPLAAYLGVANRYDTYSALQAILTEAISSLEPDDDVPADSRAWRIYDLLCCRYVQELTVPEVANQLGVSVRHLQREQRAALDVLAYTLWEQFNLAAPPTEDAPGANEEEGGPGMAPIASELAWLKDVQLEGPTDLRDALTSAIELVGPLADQHRVEIRLTIDDAVPRLAVHPVALGQMLLDLLTVAIHRAGRSGVSVAAAPLRWEAEVTVRCALPAPGKGVAPNEDLAGLQVARRVVEICGCRLALSIDAELFAARLGLPAFEQMPVLVIDDNADTLQLLRHYALGSRYRLVGTRDPIRALEIARTLAPQIVVLDVMMPQVDGWRLLGQLREHPLTRHVPVVVCTILAQDDLARSLGAADFVRKPVTQQSLLAALDRQAAQLAPEWC